jgi:basic membrane protein A
MTLLLKSRWAALLVVLALFAAACGSDDEETDAGSDETTETTAAESDDDGSMDEETDDDGSMDEDDGSMDEEGAMGGGAVCEVTDTGGVDDKSFNQLAFAGAEAAAERFGWEARVVESVQETDYEPNINSLISQGDCELIVTVGFLLADATATAANANPEQSFAIVDSAYDPPIDNVQGLVFAIDQAAFLAGYIAADQSQTGVVGTFGGINIPPVSDFMEGFAQGVAYYNEAKGTDVTVLGWSSEEQDGLFTGNFDSLEDGRSFAENLADEGADIILPVAGPVGLGSAALVQERGIRIIGVDADWQDTAPEFSDVILTSILKKIDVAVLDAATAVHDGTAGTLLVSTLESGGVGVAPLTNAYDDSTDLEAELAEITAGIIAGDIATKSS